MITREKYCKFISTPNNVCIYLNTLWVIFITLIESFHFFLLCKENQFQIFLAPFNFKILIVLSSTSEMRFIIRQTYKDPTKKILLPIRNILDLLLKFKLVHQWWKNTCQFSFMPYIEEKKFWKWVLVIYKQCL